MSPISAANIRHRFIRDCWSSCLLIGIFELQQNRSALGELFNDQLVSCLVLWLLDLISSRVD